MAFQHYVLTLNGAAQRLTLALPAVPDQAGGGDDVAARTILLQPRGTNSDPIYVGSNDLVTATNYGFRLEPGATGVPPAPFILGEHQHGPLRLSNFYVIGTSGESLHIAIVPY